MKGLVIPLAMALVGAGLGGGAAFALRPAPAAEGAHAEGAHGDRGAEDAHAEEKKAGGHAEEAKAEKGHGDAKSGHGDGKGDAGYHKIASQFVVPVIEDGRTRSLVVMALALDIVPAAADAVLDEEPRLRDALLRVLFDHANTGGFSGPFTEVERIEVLRAALLERARGIMGADVEDVLILDVARQEI